MAEASPSGLVTTQRQTGNVAVMCTFQGHVDVFRATLPLGVEVSDLPEPANFVDELVFAQLKELGLPPSKLCDDTTYLRAPRLPSLDVCRPWTRQSSSSPINRKTSD